MLNLIFFGTLMGKRRERNEMKITNYFSTFDNNIDIFKW